MNALITANEVVGIAFSPLDNMHDYAINESKILSAQLRFIEPVFGRDLFAAFLEGKYTDIVDSHIKPALAYYVRYAIIPDLASRIGNLGPQTAHTDHSGASTDRQRDLARNQAKADADTFIDNAVKLIEADIDSYPEYKAMFNVRKKVIGIGGIIIPVR